MKNLFLIVFLFLYGHVYCQKDVYSKLVTAQSHVDLKNIPTCIGKESKFIQECTKNMDPIVDTDTLRLVNAQIGLIDYCKCDYIAKNGKYEQILLVLGDDLTINQALRQAKKQFGEPKMVVSDTNTTQSWTYKQSNKVKVDIELKHDPDKKAGTLILKQTS